MKASNTEELQGPEVLQGTQALLRLRSMGSCGFVPFRRSEESGGDAIRVGERRTTCKQMLFLNTYEAGGALR